MAENSFTKTPNFTLYPLAWLAICFAVGIFAGSFFEISWQICLGICLVSIILTIGSLKKKYSIVFLFLGFVSLGGLCLQVEKLSVAPNRLKVLCDSETLKSGEPFEIMGISQGNPELAVGGFFLIIKTESIVSKGVEQKISGNVRLFLPIRDEQTANEYEQLAIGYGTKLRVACELRREEKFQNPGGISNKQILDRQGIDATAIIKSPLLIENLGKIKTFAPFEWLSERRQNLIIEFKKHFSVSTAGVLIASLLGNKYHLDKTTSESFREGGTFHILVISGLQITFIGGLAILFLRQFTRNRFWQFLLANLFLWAYTIAVGADPPVTRAALMFTVWYFAFVIFRQGTLLNTLAISALALLFWQPSNLFDQSFQLTFMCVLAIVAMSVPLLEKLQAIGKWHPQAETPVPPKAPNCLKTWCETFYWSEKNWQKELSRTVWQCKLFKTPYAEKLEHWRLQKILRYIVETIIVSMIVQVWLIPFGVIYFHRISVFSILLNVPVGALIAIESLTAIVGVFIAQLSEILAAPFMWITEVLNWLILNITLFVIGFDWSSFRLPHYAGQFGIIYLVYFVPIIALTIFLLQWSPFALKFKIQNSRFKIWFAFLSFLIFLTIIIFHPFSAPKTDGKLHVDFLDVGQGDSALVTMPTGETLLIDGGGRANFNKIYVQREDEEPELFEPDVQNIGETVVSKFLWEKGYSKIDYLLPTHADTDHIQGLTDVARNFSINSALIARTPLQDEDFAAFNKVLEQKQIPVTMVKRGDVLNFGEVKIEVLSPNADANPNAKWENNESIVLRIIYGETKFLMTGDMEKGAENEVLQLPQMLQSDVVKVAHHGSRTSSTQELIRATNAKLAIISVGKVSPFGHPHEEVVDRWKKSGAKTMTTGENGTISIISDGKNLRIENYLRTQTFR
ncbi:MAG TPA: ComEC/Rec2 family competence protein [Pyrinomonadaceae bacterium]|nr:ComEC/Rec2 family competence protein [Pyrinomonadaceae bacterium]